MKNETQLNSAAHWVKNIMLADGITAEKFAALNEQEQVELSLAYMDEVGRRIKKIENRCRVNDEARSLVQNLVVTVE